MKPRLPDRENCRQAAKMLKALAHPQRLFILCCLHQRESTVSDLEELTGASQPIISQHLTRMRLEGIVEDRREGNFVYYRMLDAQVGVLIEAMEKLFNLRPDRNR